MRFAYSRPGDAADVRQTLSALQEYGFEAAQLKGGQFAEWLDKPHEFREAFDAARVMGLIAYGPDFDKLRKTFVFAGSLGFEAVTWVPSWKRGDARHAEAVEAMNELGRSALDCGTKLSMHNHASCLFENAEDLRVFRQSADPGLVGVTLDTAHAALGGVEDVAALIRDCGEFIDVFHVKDVQGRTFCPLGRGELDFGAIFKAVRDISFDGWLVVDDESDQMTLAEALPHAAAFLKDYDVA